MFIAHIPVGLCLARLLTKRRLSFSTIAIASFGAIFPDLDLFRFYVIDGQHVHHHSYWTHLPVYWAGFIIVSILLFKICARPYPVRLTVFFAAAMSHLCLDSVSGDIRWLWPLSTEGFQFVSVPATHSKWYMSFLYHWTFKLEILISFLALCVACSGHGYKDSKKPGEASGQAKKSPCP